MSLPDQARTGAARAKELQEELGKPPTKPEEGKTGDEPGQGGPPPPVSDPKPENWEQKYRSLQGMFNTQVPKLQSDLAASQQKVASLEALIASINAAPAAPPTPAKAYLTDKDKEEFGEETLDVMRRAARQEIGSVYEGQIAELTRQIAEMKGTVVPQVQQLTTSNEQNAVARLYNDLTARVPDWKQINADNNFLNWLTEPDPMTGRTKQTFLEEAFEQRNVDRVAQFFVQWKAQVAPTPPIPTPAPNPATSQLEAMVAPGKGRGTATPSEKAPITREFIQGFYLDVAHGKYKTRPDERAKIEADIFAAQREGLVQ